MMVKCSRLLEQRLRISEHQSWSWTVECQGVLGQMVIGQALAHMGAMRHGAMLAVDDAVHRMQF